MLLSCLFLSLLALSSSLSSARPYSCDNSDAPPLVAFFRASSAALLAKSSIAFSNCRMVRRNSKIGSLNRCRLSFHRAARSSLDNRMAEICAASLRLSEGGVGGGGRVGEGGRVEGGDRGAG